MIQCIRAVRIKNHLPSIIKSYFWMLDLWISCAAAIFLLPLWLCPCHLHPCILCISSAGMRPVPASAGGVVDLAGWKHSTQHKEKPLRGLKLWADTHACVQQMEVVPLPDCEARTPRKGYTPVLRPPELVSQSFTSVLAELIPAERVRFCSYLQEWCSHGGLGNVKRVHVEAACARISVCSSLHPTQLLRNKLQETQHLFRVFEH